MIPKQSSYFRNGESISVYSPLHKKKNDVEEFNKTISQLFCDNGYDINFKCQFDNSSDEDIINVSTNRNHELPTYQWDDQKFWVKSSNENKKILNGPTITILGHQMQDSSTFNKSYQSFIDTGKDAFKYLKGHYLSGKNYCPGAAYIDNLLKIYPEQDLEISYIEFKTPLIFTDGIGQYLQTNVYQTGKSEYRAQFHFKDDRTDVWVQKCVANFQLINNGHGEVDKVDIEEIKSTKCNLTTVPWDQFYPHIKKKSGLNYTKQFQNTVECYLGDSCSLTEVSLELPENFHDQNSLFNCPIIDMCFHGSIIFIKEHFKLVLEKIEGFRYYSANIPKNRDEHSSIFIYSEAKPNKENLISTSITVMLQDGTVLIEIDNLICGSLNTIVDPIKIETPCDLFYTPYLQTRNSQIPTPSEFKPIYQNHQDKELFNGNSLISEIVLKTIKPLINERMEFRILEIGGSSNTSLSTTLLNNINLLFKENPNFEIEIEYTWTDISSSLLQDAKTMLSDLNKGNFNILYRSLKLEVGNEILEKQKLNPSYYDFIFVSNISKITKDIKYALEQVYQIITPNGHLILNEQMDSNLNQEEGLLKNLMLDCNFNSDITIYGNHESSSILIQAQKPSLQLQPKPFYKFDNVILFCNDDQQSIINKFEDYYRNNSKVIKISTIEEFYKLSDTIITDNSIIYFLKSIDQLTLDNFKVVTFEYIQINQKLYEITSKCKHVLITCDTQSSNYLTSSVLGAARYFDECPSLQLFNLDYDKESLDNLQISIIDHLTNPKLNTLIEFFIKDNGTIYFERFKKGLKNLKESFKSESYHDLYLNEQRDSLVSSLDANLEYQLKSKETILNPNEIEVQIMATGVNYKDYLIYSGLVKPKGDKIEIGVDFSGIVSRVGSKSSLEFKIGDQVYGVANETSSSHIIIDSLLACHKPEKISYIQAASIPAVFITSLHSLYNIGNLRDDESVLIHSASGGVGLSALEILKWKNHCGPIFVTVGSDDKKQYLIDTYGDLITGIYSTRNMNYKKQIKDKLKAMGSNKSGVDLILNTLSSDYIDTNFKCLNPHGRIVDLSITHLNPNEFIDNSKYRYNYGYHNVELFYVDKIVTKKALGEISKAIEIGNLNGLIPITEFSNSNFKKAIEYINERKHIGKIVVSHDTDIIGQLIESRPKIVTDYSIIKSDYKISNIGKNIIVTGQSGLILDILKWITRYNSTVENIIILSKSSMKWELEFLINNNKNGKIKYHFKQCDISNSESLDKTIDQVLTENSEITNIDYIFHFAFGQVTRKVKDIDMNSLNISHSAKTIGAINLHNQSIKRDWKLINYVLASSVLSVVGSYDQCSYVSACCVLNSLSLYRKSIGLPVLCINIGGIGGSGMITRSDVVESVLSGQGYDLIYINQFLGALDLLIQNPNNSNNLLVGVFNFPVFKNNKTKIHQKFDYIFNATETNNPNLDENSSSATSIKQKFLNKISELLSIDASKINSDIKLINYGADSLLTVQLKNWIDKEWATNLVTIHQIQSNSIGVVYQTILENFEKRKK